MSMILEDCSPSRTITAANLSKIANEQVRLSRLDFLAGSNIQNTRRLLLHNEAHNIKVFRVTSRLIPLATHPITQNWKWQEGVGQQLESLGELVRKFKCRISAHPDHYTVLNSPKAEVLETAIKDLEYHHQIFAGMGLGAEAKLVLHVGGAYADKTKYKQVFMDNYNDLPCYIRNRIILENDDKIYTVRDVLDICGKLGIPMVLDLHHHLCNNENDQISSYLPAIFDTWNRESLPPKIHISSPRSSSNLRSHADNVDPTMVIGFLQQAKSCDRDIDIMIEAKYKDLALFNLMGALTALPGIRFIDEASIEI